MPIWTESMQQSYEFCEVDPKSWGDKRLITSIVGEPELKRDLSVNTLGSATFESTEEIGEIYIRVYLVAVQNEIIHRECLGTYLCQTADRSFNGKYNSYSIDGYTPLVELTEDMPPIGYTLGKTANCMELLKDILEKHARAPRQMSNTSDKTMGDSYTLDGSTTWFDVCDILLERMEMEWSIFPNGSLSVEPNKDPTSLASVYTFTDDDESILMSDISDSKDLWGKPNVVELIYSDSGKTAKGVCINSDSNSLLSTVKRGRTILYRDSDVNVDSSASVESLEKYLTAMAKEVLKSLSITEHTITIEHSYIPIVTIGRAVRINYKKAGINVIGKVMSQSIKCKPGCTVSTEISYNEYLWGGN